MLRTEQQKAAPAQGATTGAAERAQKSLTRRHKTCAVSLNAPLMVFNARRVAANIARLLELLLKDKLG